MKTMLSCFLGMLWAAVSAHADVLIYKGTTRVKEAINAPMSLPSTSMQFVVLDLDAHTLSVFSFFTLNGKKLYQATGAPVEIHDSIHQLPKGMTATLVTLGTANFTDAEHYLDQLLYLRGTNVTLKIATEPLDRKINRPRGFAGSTRVVTAGDQHFFVEQSFSMLLQGPATIAANNAGKTSQQVIDALVTLYAGKGYTSVSPG